MNTSIARKIEETLSEVTERPVSGLAPQTRFDRDLDLDSYLFVQFLLALEDKISGLRFDPDAIGQHEFNIMTSLVSYIERQTGLAEVSDRV
jgi:acyl carrier protein